MKGYEAMTAALVAEGTEVVFGIMGGDNDNLIHCMVDNGIKYVAVRHEQGAVGMADGYSRATGRPGVATVTLGPGITNSATPFTAARLSGSKVLVLVGDKRSGDTLEDRFGNMMIEHHGLLASTIGGYVELSAARNIARDVQSCFRKLRGGGGPVAINTPWDVLDASEVDDDWSYTPAEQVMPASPRIGPDAMALHTLAEWLEGSERPVFIGGLGVVSADARQAVADLAERAGAVLATTLAARGLFKGDPFNVGVSGGFALDDSRAILERADLVIGFGASLNSYTLDRGRLYRDARIARIDHDPRAIAGLAEGTHLGVVADARLAAEQLAAAVDSPKTRWRTDEMRASIAAIDGWRGIEFTNPPDCMDPRLVTRLADELLPARRQLVIDIGQFMAVPAMHMELDAPGDLVMPWRLGAIGQALPAAVGAALGRPAILTVLFVGDGGIMTTIAELETAARYSIPLLVIVIDDGGYGAERYACVTSDRPSDLVDFHNPDFAGMASAMGLDSHTVTSPEQLSKVLTTPLATDRPTLIRAMVDRDVYAPELFRAQSNFRGRDE